MKEKIVKTIKIPFKGKDIACKIRENDPKNKEHPKGYKYTAILKMPEWREERGMFVSFNSLENGEFLVREHFEDMVSPKTEGMRFVLKKPRWESKEYPEQIKKIEKEFAKRYSGKRSDFLVLKNHLVVNKYMNQTHFHGRDLKSVEILDGMAGEYWGGLERIAMPSEFPHV